MKRYIIPIIFFIIAILIMESSGILKLISKPEKEFPHQLASIQYAIEQKEWDTAFQKSEEAQESFRGITKKIQFSAERNEINMINDSFAQMKGFIKAEDQPGALAQIFQIINHWDELGS